MTVELHPSQPSICEILVWVWALTLWLEEFRQVCLRLFTALLHSTGYVTKHSVEAKPMFLLVQACAQVLYADSISDYLLFN